MRKLLPLLFFLLLLGCEEETLQSPQVLFFAPENEVRFPISIFLDGKEVGSLTEPTIFDTEFPSLEDTTVVVVDVEAGLCKFEAFTANLTDKDLEEINDDDDSGLFIGKLINYEITAEDGYVHVITVSFDDTREIQRVEQSEL